MRYLEGFTRDAEADMNRGETRAHFVNPRLFFVKHGMSWSVPIRNTWRVETSMRHLVGCKRNAEAELKRRGGGRRTHIFNRGRFLVNMLRWFTEVFGLFLTCVMVCRTRT